MTATQRTIWKFVMTAPDTHFDMPEGTEVLYVDTDRSGLVCLWASCDPGARKESRHFAAMPTGGAVPTEGYIGTTVTQGGLVWHVFEELKP